jgi:hypothetical protein
MLFGNKKKKSIVDRDEVDCITKVIEDENC